MLGLIRDSKVFALVFKSSFMSQLLIAVIVLTVALQVSTTLVTIFTYKTMSTRITSMKVYVSNEQQIETTSANFVKFCIVSIIDSFAFTLSILNMIDTSNYSSSFASDRSSGNFQGQTGTSDSFVVSGNASTFAHPVKNLTQLGPHKDGFEQSRYALGCLLLFGFVFFALLMSQYGPLIYCCSVGGILGKHVENFCAAYVDSMYDQLAGYVFQEGADPSDPSSEPAVDDECSERVPDPNELSLVKTGRAPSDHKSTLRRVNSRSSDKSTTDASNKNRLESDVLFEQRSGVERLLAFFDIIAEVCASTARRLAVRRYLASAEMKVTKLSTSHAAKLTEQMKVANSGLIRLRLRKMQQLLSQVRDIVDELSQAAFQLVSLIILQAILFVVLSTTMSIQASEYMTPSMLLSPVMFCVGLSLLILIVSICFDEVVSQNNTMINKIFDFIVINHRDTSDSGNKSSSNGKTCVSESKLKAFDATSNSKQLLVAQAYIDEALCETWSQFQYVRELSNTILFNLGGFFPVTKRVVLMLQAYALSATFISIEMKNIIDISSAA